MLFYQLLCHFRSYTFQSEFLVEEMSQSVSIRFQFNEIFPLNPVTIIDSLLESGWSYNDYEKISYLPLGNLDDLFDWQRENINNWYKVKNLITQKCEKKEIIGISMVWKESLSGGQFLFSTKDSSFSVHLSINRKPIFGLAPATDFTWYLEKLLPPLEKMNLQVLEIICDELRY